MGNCTNSSVSVSFIRSPSHLIQTGTPFTFISSCHSHSIDHFHHFTIHLLCCDYSSASGVIHITKGSVVDFTGQCIVNAANTGMLGGGGVDGAISAAGGEALYQLRQQIPFLAGSNHDRCKVGDARLTRSGKGHNNLQCDFVIHAVGPDYRTSRVSVGKSDALLYNAYARCMALAKSHHIQTIAFCLISASIFRGTQSLDEVLKIGLRVVRDKVFDGVHCFIVAYSEEELRTLAKCSLEVLGNPDVIHHRIQGLDYSKEYLSDNVVSKDNEHVVLSTNSGQMTDKFKISELISMENLEQDQDPVISDTESEEEKADSDHDNDDNDDNVEFPTEHPLPPNLPHERDTFLHPNTSKIEDFEDTPNAEPIVIGCEPDIHDDDTAIDILGKYVRKYGLSARNNLSRLIENDDEKVWRMVDAEIANEIPSTSPTDENPVTNDRDTHSPTLPLDSEADNISIGQRVDPMVSPQETSDSIPSSIGGNSFLRDMQERMEVRRQTADGLVRDISITRAVIVVFGSLYALKMMADLFEWNDWIFVCIAVPFCLLLG